MRMDVLPYNNDNLLLNFPPFLRRNVEELFLHGKLGLTPFTSNDISPLLAKQYTEDNNSVYSYHYTLKIPYAGKRLSWELIFNPEDLNFAPDFDFNDDQFLSNPDVELVIDNVPSLVNWNIKNPKSLRLVLEEFIRLYKRVQVDKLHKENMYSRISTEYDLFTQEGKASNDVEVSVEPTAVHFLINIIVDTSSLPDYLQPTNNTGKLLNPGQDVATLKVSFVKLDGSRVNTSLHFSPRLEQVLGSSKTLHIPTYTRQTSLIEYVPLVSKLLEDLVKKVELQHKLKKEYISYLCTIRNKSIVECDAETFTGASFLCEVDDYHCLVHIEIGNNFPLEKPVVTLHSVYCGYPKKPCSEVVENYPYSPRWTPDEMLRRLLAHLADTIPKFKNHTH